MTRRRRIRRKKVEEPVEEEVIEEEEELEEELDDLEDDDYDDDEEYEDDDEEELEPEPPPKPTKPAPKKVKKPVAKKKPAPKPKAEPEPEVIEVKKVDTVIAEEVLTGLLDAMDDGQSINITRVSGKQWQLSSGKAAVAAGPRLKGKEFDIEVQTPEYREWHEDWSTLTYAEKKKEAKRLKANWETHSDERVDNIRISAAVRAKLGIEKYKPEYRTQAARNAVKG